MDINNFYNQENTYVESGDSSVESIKDELDNTSTTNNIVEENNENGEEQEKFTFKPIKIKIIGIGGGGNNAIKRISILHKQFPSVDLYAANTDQQVLKYIEDKHPDVTTIPLGGGLTKGFGAGSDPVRGKEATELSRDEIKLNLKDANLIFIAAGMGGGTGTGGAPIVAKIARDMNIPVIGVVTYPMTWEGSKKAQVADKGIEELRKYVDVLSVVYNERALQNNQNGTVNEVFYKADQVLLDTIKAVTDVILNLSVVNVDFADLVTVIKDKKTAHIAQGSAKGENRLSRALQMAAVNKLLGTSIQDCTNIIVNINYDKRLPCKEMDEVLPSIREVADPNVNIISGYGCDENLEDEVYVTIIATGFKETVGNPDDKKPENNNEVDTKTSDDTIDSFIGRLFN
ncbi:MAG: cell division protein FtsZ [Clostridia bacterium]|nr:cell division protein FtsZ [Clostridia bacterium]